MERTFIYFRLNFITMISAKCGSTPLKSNELTDIKTFCGKVALCNKKYKIF